LVIEAREQLNEILRHARLEPRSTAEYQALLEETAKHDETNDESKDAKPEQSDKPDEPGEPTA